MSRGYSTSQPVPSCKPVHDVARKDQEALGSCSSSARPDRPLIRGLVQQRGHARRLWTWRIAQPATGARQGDRGLVDAALDGVLQFELEQGCQPGEVDPVPPGQQATRR